MSLLFQSLAGQVHQSVNPGTDMISNFYLWLKGCKTIKMLYRAQQSKEESMQVRLSGISNAVNATIPVKKDKVFKSAQLSC